MAYSNTVMFVLASNDIEGKQPTDFNYELVNHICTVVADLSTTNS